MYTNAANYDLVLTELFVLCSLCMVKPYIKNLVGIHFNLFEKNNKSTNQPTKKPSHEKENQSQKKTNKTSKKNTNKTPTNPESIFRIEKG